MRSRSLVLPFMLCVSFGFQALLAQESSDKSTRRSLLDESSRKLVEPKRLPGTLTSGPSKPVTTKEPTESSSTASITIESSTLESSSEGAVDSESGAKTDVKSEPLASSPTKQTLRKVEPKKLVETAGPESGEKVTLRYRFKPGTVIRGEVTHLAKNGTRIDSVQQEANSRTVSQKSWRVIEADGTTVTFEYWIDGIDMSQHVGDGAEIRYSSNEPTDKIPPQFAGAADTVGKLVSTISIDDTGMVVARSDINNPPHMGMGDVTLPLPKNPVSVGATWEIPREMKINRKDGTQRIVKFRELFKLEKISAGVATVSVKSEPLSTMGESSEEAQVLQQLSNGTIRFDIDAGHMISKELAWDHQVVAFSGPGSVLEYSARLSDQVVSVETESESETRNQRSAKTIGSGVR